MRLILSPILALLLSGCTIPLPMLEQVKRNGVLIVATRNSPTTYYEGREGIEGFEHDLVQEFARELGVKVEFVRPERFPDLLPMVVNGEVQMAAAGLVVTDRRMTSLRFTPAFQQITAQLVSSGETKKPQKLEDLTGRSLEVVADSSHDEELERLKAEHPELQWTARPDMGSEELLYLVHQQVLDFTVADSNEIAINQRFYPDLEVAFDIGPPRDVGWAFPHTQDRSLYDAACDFIERMKKSGRIAQLVERYFGPLKPFDDKEDGRSFRRHVAQRLPQYLDLFRQASEENDLDWALLAAVGYQESHWDPAAVSPTGVRGLMMLTVSTAERLGVQDRTDAAQSILAGSRYLADLEKRLPKSIKPPDRLAFALAAYNVGLAHLEDARVLTQRLGGNPSRWEEVKERLPLLARESYHTTVKHGYARGRQAVIFVENVKRYHEQLAWDDSFPSPEDVKAPETSYPLKILPLAL